MSEEIKVVIQLLQFVCLFGLALYTFISNRNAARSAEVHELGERLVAVEQNLKHLPDYGLVSCLDGDIRAVRAELTTIREMMTNTQRDIQRINDYLLNNK